LKPDNAPELIEFALFFPEEGRWDNNGRRNYQIPLAGAVAHSGSLRDAMQKQRGSGETVFERIFDVDGAGQLAAQVLKDGQNYRVQLVSDIAGPLMLHWGVARRSPHEWLQPPESWRPQGTVLAGAQTGQTPFAVHEGFGRIELVVQEGDAPLGIQFVLRQGADGRWLKHRQGNFYMPIQAQAAQAQGLKAGELTEMAERIVQAEMNSGSWTLMHRFNLCFDL